MIAPLDLGFQPAVKLYRRHQMNATVPLVLGLEREGGLISRYETKLDPTDPVVFRYVERIVKFLLWARGGWRLFVGGPHDLGEKIRTWYSPTGLRTFDVTLMEKVYERRFEVVPVATGEVPSAREGGATMGGHLNGCRIGFDLGASDFKIAAVQDGTVVHSEEVPWHPRVESDPEYHYQRIQEGLKRAASHLPRVDAIGGSTAGVVVNNKIMVASLFRAVPAEKLNATRDIFLRLRLAWGVPLEVANDGDVTALAGAMSLQAKGILGIAMGSSEAAGFMNKKGRILGWLNELAFAPVDYNPDAAVDEWSQDRGVGASYFSQQAVNKLLPAAGIELPKEMGLPERLKEVQHLMAKDDPRAAKIYETIGVYLGYTIPHYAEFYDFNHMLILGRVTTGKGGDIVIAKAREVLQTEFPEVAARIQIHVPDEKSRRVGQAVAAASLPEVPQ